LVTHLAFLDDVKDFDRVRREKLFEILQSKSIPNLLLKGKIEIYFGNEIKVKQLVTKKYTINHGVKQCFPLSPTYSTIT